MTRFDVVDRDAGPDPPADEISGGGDGGGFDRRLTRLEEKVPQLTVDVTRLKEKVLQLTADVARLKEKVLQLTADVARKADIEALKTQIESSNTRTERVRTEIETVRTEISRTNGELTKQIGDKQDSATKWTVGTGATAVAVIVALLKLIP